MGDTTQGPEERRGTSARDPRLLAAADITRVADPREREQQPDVGELEDFFRNVLEGADPSGGLFTAMMGLTPENRSTTTQVGSALATTVVPLRALTNAPDFLRTVGRRVDAEGFFTRLGLQERATDLLSEAAQRAADLGDNELARHFTERLVSVADGGVPDRLLIDIGNDAFEFLRNFPSRLVPEEVGFRAFMAPTETREFVRRIFSEGVGETLSRGEQILRGLGDILGGPGPEAELRLFAPELLDAAGRGAQRLLQQFPGGTEER